MMSCHVMSFTVILWISTYSYSRSNYSAWTTCGRVNLLEHPRAPHQTSLYNLSKVALACIVRCVGYRKELSLLSTAAHSLHTRC
jgi:hypothetical protein